MFIFSILSLPCVCLTWYQSGRTPALLKFEPLVLCHFSVCHFCPLLIRIDTIPSLLLIIVNNNRFSFRFRPEE